MSRSLGTVLLMGVLFGAAPVAQGQDAPRFGVSLGLNVATLEAPGSPEVRGMAVGGVMMQIPVVGPLSVQPQLLFSQKGATVRGQGSIRYGAGYIDLPVLLRLSLPSLGSVTPYALAGGFGGVKVFEQQRAGGDLSLPLPDRGTTFFTRTNAGLTGGMGGTISFGRDRRLNLAVRYGHGLVDVARSVESQPYDQAPFPATAETRTWTITLQLGM